MAPVDPRTPVIIGVGQSVDRFDAPDYHGWSGPDLAAAAARAALADAAATGDVASAIDAIATTRTFEDSTPAPAPFGKASNFPRSIARRLGIAPRHALWTKAGGNTPQDLVAELGARIVAGEFEAALIAGAEAISTVRHATRNGAVLDFAEDADGQVEDRGMGLEDFADPLTYRAGLTAAPLYYALAENARRARLGQDRAGYDAAMGALFAPFSAVASDNPFSASAVNAYSPEELTTVTPHNRWIAHPYPLRLVARDQVNQGAAVIIASVATARRLGVPEEKFVFLHGHAHAREKLLLHRPDLGASPAATAAARAALDMAETTAAGIDAFDFYSCFPIAVSNVAIDGMGLAADDPRGLTVTGGLPFFGGPGNNYSMHAIAEIVARARRRPGSRGFVGANGGFLSKYSVGIYSTAPAPWRDDRSAALQSALDAAYGPPVDPAFIGQGMLESFTIRFDQGEPRYAVIAGRTPDGARFIARSDAGDAGMIGTLLEEDRFGSPVAVSAGDKGGIAAFAR
ncbi:acetyl-CoA acetyltransferase [Sphingomonas sp.]|uniref:acetyl-CoA acetyltransferase n=1 Tax=Sphingomonas sp. TaxID=28214 RepID=UPI003CC5E7C1